VPVSVAAEFENVSWHEHPPPLAAAHVAVGASVCNSWPSRAQVKVTPLDVRHAAGNVIVSEPDDARVDVYVPSALIVTVPVTASEDCTGTEPHVPDVVDDETKHEDVTVQLPTIAPPHGLTFEQAAPPLPLLEHAANGNRARAAISQIRMFMVGESR